MVAWPHAADRWRAVTAVTPGLRPGATCQAIDNQRKGLNVTFGENRELAFTPPEVPLGIIPAVGGGETHSAALVDVRLCASLLIVIVVVAAIVLLPGARPPAKDVPGLWPLVLPTVLSLAGLSCRRRHTAPTRDRDCWSPRSGGRPHPGLAKGTSDGRAITTNAMRLL